MASYLYNTTDPTLDLKRNLSYGKQSLDGPLFQQRAFCFRLPGYQKFTFSRKPLMMALQQKIFNGHMLPPVPVKRLISLSFTSRVEGARVTTRPFRSINPATKMPCRQ